MGRGVFRRSQGAQLLVCGGPAAIASTLPSWTYIRSCLPPRRGRSVPPRGRRRRVALDGEARVGPTTERRARQRVRLNSPLALAMLLECRLESCNDKRALVKAVLCLVEDEVMKL